MRRTALAISPHLDDAVFSCGGTLAKLAAAGWQVVVATVFTGSVANPTGFALECQLDKGLDAAVDYMALRRDEDAAACAALGAEPRWLPFREAPHRGYDSAAQLFGPILSTDWVGISLRPALRALLGTVQPDLLLAPQAIGGHVDHVQVVQAIRSLGLTLPMLWWRDFPYVMREAPRAPFAASLADHAELAVSVTPEPRHRACAAYASQLGYQFGGTGGLTEILGEAGLVERFRCAGVPQVEGIADPREIAILLNAGETL